MPDAQVDLDHILQGQRVPGQQSAQPAQPLRGTGCRRAHDSGRGCSFLQQNARRRGNTDSGRHRAARPLRVQDWVDDLAGLLDALHIERFHGVGHSLGTLVLQEFAAREPQRVASLALLAINRGPSEERRAAMRERARKVAAGGIGPLIETLIQAGPSPQTRADAPLRLP